MNSNIFTFRGCTIEVASGCKTATATRHLTGKSEEFASTPTVTAQVLAQYWAMGQVAELAEPADEPTEIDETNDVE